MPLRTPVLDEGGLGTDDGRGGTVRPPGLTAPARAAHTSRNIEEAHGHHRETARGPAPAHRTGAGHRRSHLGHLLPPLPSPVPMMDRDPIVFAWHSAKRRHAAAIAVALGLGGPLVGLGLLALRDLVDELLALAEPGRGPIHFLHLVVPLPERFGGHGLVLVRGWPLPESALTLWALGCLIGVAFSLALLGWGVARLCVSAQAEAVRRLRELAEDAILRSGPASRDDARALAGQVGAAIRAADGLLAVGILVPALAAGAVLVTLAVAAAVAPRLVAVAGISLVAAALARQLLITRTERRTTSAGWKAPPWSAA